MRRIIAIDEKPAIAAPVERALRPLTRRNERLACGVCESFLEEAGWPVAVVTVGDAPAVGRPDGAVLQAYVVSKARGRAAREIVNPDVIRPIA